MVETSDKAEAPSGEPLDVVVVGAGFAGMYMLHKLRAQGFSARVLEAGGDVGGTWYWNRYPGARCDVESMSYSYSFDDRLQQDWTWSHRYAPQPEILDYARHVAARFDLRRDITFDCRVTAARYDDPTGLWTLSSDQGEEIVARHCVMATGCLSTPKLPEIDGIGTFRGECHHTGDWPHDGVDFTGKRVALIGTGASGVQSAPVIAAEAAHLTVFQRTANFCAPAWNAPLQPDAVADWKANYDHWRTRERTTHTGFHNEGGHPAAAKLSPGEQQDVLEAQWRQGGLLMWNVFSDLMTNGDANETASEFMRAKIRDVVENPETAERLCPRTHPMGSKRLCVDTDYYETFNRDNVTLIDIADDPIERLTPEGLMQGGREHAFDVIVFATGFDAMTGTLLRMDIEGRGGLKLRDKWRNGPKSYLGLAIAGFPNFFTITGPGSPSVMSHVLMSLEQHVDWITDCLVRMREQGMDVIEATGAAERAWVDHVNDVVSGTLFVEADSWYMGANVPGKSVGFMPYIGGAHKYRERCDEIAANGYEGFEMTKSADQTG